MLEVQYLKTGTKEKPSYDAMLVHQDTEEGSAPQGLKLATIAKTTMETELGEIPCWSATGPGAGDGIRRKTLGELRSLIENRLFGDVKNAHTNPEQLELPFPEPKARKVKEADGTAEIEAEFARPASFGAHRGDFSKSS